MARSIDSTTWPRQIGICTFLPSLWEGDIEKLACLRLQMSLQTGLLHDHHRYVPPTDPVHQLG